MQYIVVQAYLSWAGVARHQHIQIAIQRDAVPKKMFTPLMLFQSPSKEGEATRYQEQMARKTKTPATAPRNRHARVITVLRLILTSQKCTYPEMPIDWLLAGSLCSIIVERRIFLPAMHKALFKPGYLSLI